MKIRVNDCIGRAWTIAFVDVAKPVWVCCRADPDLTLLTFTFWVGFREWMSSLLESSEIERIKGMMELHTRQNAVLNRLSAELQKCLRERDNAYAMCDREYAGRCADRAKELSEEIEKVEGKNNEM
jgi:hypothetical protein